jgi:hypothetical protein
MIRRLSRLALAVASFCTASTVHAQMWKEEINTQLIRSSIVSDLIDSRFRVTHSPFYSVLSAYESEEMTVELARGVTYAFVGKCDNDCRDIDFRLYDGYGRLIDQDLSHDDYPLVRVTPTRSGTFRLRVAMPGCTTRSCGWGVLVLGR